MDSAGKSNRFSKYGWDKNALFYPNKLIEKLFVSIFGLLVITHFSEIFGISDSQYLIYEFLPLEFAYNLMHAILSLLFILLVYREWPSKEGDSHE